MRDINAYTEVYCVSDFEQLYQVYYRRKKYLSFLMVKNMIRFWKLVAECRA